MAYTWTTGETITAENLNKTGGLLVEEIDLDSYTKALDIKAGDLLGLMLDGIVITIVNESQENAEVLSYGYVSGGSYTFKTAYTGKTYTANSASDKPSYEL